jgi:methanethiol S-methyltransferase
MIVWLNVVCLVVATILTALFYVKSAGPAALERQIGAAAYTRCGVYRTISMVFMFVGMVNYVVYYSHPLPLPLPEAFPWSHWTSAVAGTAMALPAGYLMARGMRDAGKEALVPQKGKRSMEASTSASVTRRHGRQCCGSHSPSGCIRPSWCSTPLCGLQWSI